MDSYHQSVFLNEILEFLKISPDGWYLDATLGDGGHSLSILEKGGRVYCLDVDPEAIERAKRRFQSAGYDDSRFKISQGNFKDLDSLIPEEFIFSGAVFDLGVSTLQLTKPERGFSFLNEGPLDMRMDPTLQVKAVDLLNALNKGELNELFQNYGQDPYAKKVAEAVVRSRPLTSTTEFARLVENVVGGRYSKIHPATRIFQALRIAVNDEIEVIKEAMPKILEKMIPQGRICVISFHSLEDKVIKETFKHWESQDKGKILTDKPLEPSFVEVSSNIRSRSAKLRVFER